MRLGRRGVLPGFGLSLGYTLFYVGFLVLLPLAALVMKTSTLGFGEMLQIVTERRAIAAYELSFSASLVGAFVNAVFGVVLAWVLVRYEFPGRDVLDALVDLPFALPTAVAGIALTTVYAENGFFGAFLAKLGIKVAFAPLGVAVALTFVGIPFVVRTVQPVLEELDDDVEEAAALLGATRFQTFTRVIFPAIFPSLLTGFALALARALGEYGSVVFISGNMPMKTEIAPLLIVTKLEQYDYAGATAIASVMLAASFLLLFAVNFDPALGEAGRSMSGTVSIVPGRAAERRRNSLGGGAASRVALIALAVAFIAVFLLAPVFTVFASAFSKGLGPYFDALVSDEALAAIRLTLLTAAIVVPLNLVFGVAAAWLISKYEFTGKSVLLTLIDLPFSVSPVISGLVFVLLFGSHGWLGPFLSEHDIHIIFAVPGIVLATAFVTFPLVAREVLAVMQAQGSDEEEAALTLGASGFQILFRITLPKVRWGIIYGVILCNARAMGEFGAVSVVSGHVRGETNTMPLHIEILYNEYNFVGAFSVASLLVLLAFFTLGVKKAAEWASRARSRRSDDRDGVAPDLLERVGSTVP